MKKTEDEGIMNRIKLIMKEFYLNERQFAIKIGKKQQTVNSMFKREKDDIMLSTAIDILTAFPDISADWFLFGRGSMKREEGLVIMAQNDDLVAALKENIALLKENNAMLKEKVRRLEAGEKDPVASCAGYGFIAAEGSVKELVP